MDKYQELYQLSKEAFNEELERFFRIDEKATKYLSVITLVLGFLPFVSNWSITKIIPPSSYIEWFLFVIGILFCLSVFASWIITFSVLKLHKVGKIPLSSEMIDFFDNHSLLNIYYTLSKSNKDVLLMNRKQVNKKSKRLYYAYQTIIASGIFLLILFLLTLIYNWGGW
jgi:hypothetical protein